MSDIKETVSFICSLKKCKKNIYYKMTIINEEKTIGDFPFLETEEIYNEKENSNIHFKTSLKGIEFRFGKLQKFKIQIRKRESRYNNGDTFERLTIMSSLVTSPNQIYERKVNENDENSEIFSIELEKQNDYMNSCCSCFSDNSLIKYFKENGRIKLLFLIDFSYKENNSGYLNSQNIMYNLLVNFYNALHIYTYNHELYFREEGIKTPNYEDNCEFRTFNSFNLAEDYYLNILNNVEKNDVLSINSCLENSNKEIQDGFFNILFIFIGNCPQDITVALEKIKEMRSNKLPVNIVLLNVGNKFQEKLYNQIDECLNVIFFETKDSSQKGLMKIVVKSLNIIGKNIIEFRQSSQNNNTKLDKNSINSDDEIGSKYDDGDNSDKSEEKSDEININKNKENKISKYQGNPDLIMKKLDSSENPIINSDNPFASIIQNDPIKESQNESDSGTIEKDSRIAGSEINFAKPLNKDEEIEEKIVDSNTKTDSNSVNNKINPRTFSDDINY